MRRYNTNNMNVTEPKHHPVVVQFTSEYALTAKNFLLSILEDEFGHTNVPRPDLDNIEKYYQSGQGNFWLALIHHEVVGTVGLKDYGSGVGFIQRMSILKELRGTGLAQKLLYTLEDFAREHSCKYLYLATSEDLQAANQFYLKEGYQRVESLPAKIPVPIAKMYYKKDL